MKIKAGAMVLLGCLAALCSFRATASCDKPCREQRALLGSGEDALMLANSSIKADRQRMIYWYRIAAENGSVSGQHNYGVFLLTDSKGAHDCWRALFWLKRASKAGNKYSTDYVVPLENGLMKGHFKAGCSQVID